MKEGKIGVVIVNYNGAAYQNKALKTIYDSSYKNIDVIIVDSDSKDNSIELAQNAYPQAHYLLQNENVGVAKGYNIGARYAIDKLDAEYILLINNDIELDNKAIERLIKKADKSTITVPKIYYYEPHDMIWFAGGKMYWKKGESGHIGNFETDKGQYDEEHIIEYSPACCMLIHRDVFAKVGYIDETVFMYFDDTDLCVRMNDAGFKILYVPSAYLWHKVSSSGGGMDSKVYVYYNFRNKFYFMNKYKDRLQFPARIFTYTKLLAKFLLSPVYKKNDKYILKAWIDYRHGRMGRCDDL
ncbi:MAG: glycosyltransferase family 2 protein [Hungatella sp.]|jgi:hypothetical protein|nr:glycosyltransferase family 2 protein [Hungatella sp.]